MRRRHAAEQVDVADRMDVARDDAQRFERAQQWGDEGFDLLDGGWHAGRVGRDRAWRKRVRDFGDRRAHYK